jgi:hypothetical protein
VPYLAILLAVFGISFPAGDPSPKRPTMPRGCFSKMLWSADDQDRPCVWITQVEEDGSFRAAVSNAGGDVHYRVAVGNPAD